MESRRDRNLRRMMTCGKPIREQMQWRRWHTELRSTKRLLVRLHWPAIRALNAPAAP